MKSNGGPGVGLHEEASRQLAVCNACRYCEGFCPVWPIMERRTSFAESDLYYLANVCHDCKACYYACPYTEPNELRLNIPDVLSRLRLESYENYASPRFFRFLRRGTQFLLAAALSVLVSIVAALAIGSPQRLGALHLELGSFYAIFPYPVLVGVGSAIGALVVASYLYNVARFYHDIAGGKTPGLRAMMGGAFDVLWHNGFKGGWRDLGEKAGCYHEETEPSYRFLALHAMVFYGFLSALAATIAAAVEQDGLGYLPPYPLLSVPVILGVAGGVCIIGGTVGFLVSERRADARPIFKGMKTLDYAFLLTLALTATTGLLTLALRATPFMGEVFTIHMGFVLLLFVTAPYGKFVHFTYRYVALVFNRVEELA